MDDTPEANSFDEYMPALPTRVERALARERAYWRTLRDGGVITTEQGWEAVRREWGDAR